MTLESVEQVTTWAEREKRKADLPAYGAAYRKQVVREAQRRAATAARAAITEAEPDATQNIQLKSGEWVKREAFEKLTPEDQDRLMRLGIQGFRDYYAQQEQEFKAANVQLRTGEWIPKETYNALSAEDKELLNRIGIEEFNRRKQAEFAEFRAQHVQLDTGEWVRSEDYNKLPAEWQSAMKSRGVEGFKQWLPKAYGGATSYLLVDIGGVQRVFGDTRSIPNYPYPYDPNIALDAGGNRVWIGGRWPTSVTRASMGIDALSGRWPAAVKTIVPVTTQPHQYMGLPTALGGTWGQTPETLAAQKLGGGIIGYEDVTPEQARRLTEAAIAQLTPEQRARYEAEIRAIQAMPGQTIQEKLAARAQYRVAEEVVVRESSKYEGMGAKLLIGWDENQPVIIVQLKTGEVMLKDVFDDLSPSDQRTVVEKGHLILYTQLPDGNYVRTKDLEELEKAHPGIKDMAIAWGLDAAIKRLEQQLVSTGWQQYIENSIKEVEARLAEIRAEKERQGEHEPILQKFKRVLAMPVTGEDIAKEILSVGGTRTLSFNERDIEEDYHKARLEMLKEGYDIAIPLERYKQEVIEKQATLKELGMLTMPFEYVREGRWEELHTWEKFVYPILDVAMMAPVVGWAAKGVGIAAKATSMGAKIAAAGGKNAVRFAAAEAIKNVEKASVKLAAREAMLTQVRQDLQIGIKGVPRAALEKAVKAAERDLVIAQKEFQQIGMQARQLQIMAQAAEKVPEKAVGKAVLETAERVERLASPKTAIGGTARFLLDEGEAGVIVGTTIANWNDLTPNQRIAALAIAAVSAGIPGRTINMVENIVDPFKVPYTALKPRALPSRPGLVGEIYNPGGDNTLRLFVSDEPRIPTARYKEARAAVADLMRQLSRGEPTAVAIYQGKQIRVKGTGLQAIVAKGEHVAVSGTPMGDVFKRGTASELERYLYELQEAGIVYKVEGARPHIGTVVAGGEGGLYLGPGLHTRFVFQTAGGLKGQLHAGLLVHFPEIARLPRALRNLPMAANEMRTAAIKYFDGARGAGQVVEGFKKFGRAQELELVVTNGTELLRTKNLRSRLAEKLHLNRGEYYTRTPEGRIELFQLYIAGGRSTPYTLKELYELKEVALRNALEDLFFGVQQTIRDLQEGRIRTGISEALVTKEQAIKAAFDAIDADVRAGRISKKDARLAKIDMIRDIKEKFRSPFDRTALRREIARTVARGEPIYKFDPVSTDEIERRLRNRKLDPARVAELRMRSDLRPEQLRRMARAEVRLRREGLRREGLRREEPRREEPRREPERRAGELRRDELPREELPRDEPPRQEPPRQEPPRQEPPREEPPRQEPPRQEPPRDEPPRDEPPPDYPPKFPKLPSSFEELTEMQKRGSIAWKQGWCYHLIYPPYREENILHSREPFPGVRTHTGKGSAYMSPVRIAGETPDEVQRELGIMSVKFVVPKPRAFAMGNGQARHPRIHFTPKGTGVTLAIGGVKT